MLRQMNAANVPWQLVEGVDARILTEPLEQLTTPEMRADPRFRTGAIGCALSHRRAYEAIIESGASSAVVLEDDVILPESFGRLAASIGARIRGAEVVLLNFHHPDGVQLVAAGSDRCGVDMIIASPSNLEGLTSGAAYIVSREACERLREAILPMRFFSDDWGQLVSSGSLDSVRCVIPMPVRQSPTFRTTIDYYPLDSWQLRVRQAVSRLGIDRVPVIRGTISRRRQREFDRWGAGKVEIVDAASHAADVG